MTMNEGNQNQIDLDDQDRDDHRASGEQQHSAGHSADQAGQQDRQHDRQQGAAQLYAKTWKFSWRYWRQHPGLVLGVLGASFVMTLADILAPWVAGWIVDAVTVERSFVTAMWA